ncbi:hypothetical protein DPMN_086832 [Dreissena polymorpha]|uniref:ShKT domain-containing protein n=1 Tax=Dreissena polymorpha TaxID=45954 RepID=A0A9D4QVJ2_DREPO|nr:hypothetical protein DPMN_086832 [Dreissena polymorpha]
MPDNCRKSCRLCVECENIHNTLECDNWALSNECSLNPNWMNPNCRKSCSAREMAAVETEVISVFFVVVDVFILLNSHNIV